MANFETKIEIFKGRLLRTVRKKYAEAPELDGNGKIIYEIVKGPDGKDFIPEGKTKPKRKQKKKRFKDLDYIFEFYTIVCSLDDFLISLHEDAIGKAKEDKLPKTEVEMKKLLRDGVAFITRRFRKNQLPENFIKDANRLLALVDGIEKEINSYFEKSNPRFPRDLVLKLAKSKKYRVVVDRTHSLIDMCFQFMKVPVTTKRKSNPTLRIPYYQFSLKKELARQISKLEGEDADYLQAVSNMVMAQDKDLELELRTQGYEVYTSTVYEGPRKQLVKVAYRKGISKLKEVKEPRAPESIAGFNDMSEEAKVSIRLKYTEKREEYETYLANKQTLIVGVYSAEFMTEDGDKREYKSFSSIEKFKEALKKEVESEKVRNDLFPTVKYRKDIDGSQISFSAGRGGVSYTLPRYEETDFLEEEDRLVQITDGAGGGRGLRRILAVKGALVNGEVRDVITKGKYRGHFLEDMVNINGRLVEGSYMVNIGGELQKRDLINDGEISTIYRDEEGAVKTRLLEPYITVSADGERLVIGIPQGLSSRVDRSTMKSLSEEIATIESKLQFVIPDNLLKKGLNKEEKFLKRQLTQANRDNPFYYFRPEDFEIVRDALGSVAMSSAASKLISKFNKKLTERERALNEENLKNFSSQAIPGFKASLPNGKPFNFNNKQVEAMAWMDANDMSGLMALDTGVGKTLLTVGAIQKSIVDEKAGDKRFLMVAPKSLVGNLTSEARSKMDGESFKVIYSRLDEMDYDEYTALFEEKSNKYFKDTYHACFFDEVNEAFDKKKKFESVSGLLHPRKVLLTASAIEKDPTDLYKFVTIAQGVPYDTKKEKAWTQRYGNLIGGRFVGINKDPSIQAEFYKWVKSNAYFTDKMDVDMEAIDRPVLQPLKKVDPIAVKMNPKVRKEYKKVSAELARELKGMLDKYRDNVEDPEAFQYETDVNRRGKKVKVVKTLRDLANIKVNSLMKRLVRLSTDPENDKEMKEILGDNYRNPKLDATKRILKGSPESRVIFFTQSARLAVSTAKDNALVRPAKYHAVLQKSKISFVQAKGKTVKTIATIKADTDLQELKNSPKGLALLKTASGGWNVDAVAEFIAENYNVSTICCTDDYSKGFNLQKFQKVVHLDRGNGFDSENLSQRTARAFRAGQLDEVEEIFIDSTIKDQRDTDGNVTIDSLDADEVNIQELQRLLNEKDQSFFTDIIRKGMNEDLLSGMDRVETMSGEQVALSRYGATTQSYVAKLLNPTDEAVRKFNDREELKKENPLIHSATLAPERFENMGEKVELRISGFPANPLKNEDLVKKALDLAGVSASPLKDYHSIMIKVEKNYSDQLSKMVVKLTVIATDNKGAQMIRAVFLSPIDEDKNTHDLYRIVEKEPNKLFTLFKPSILKNTAIQKSECSPKGWGTKTVLSQIKTSVELGVEQIRVKAVGREYDTGDSYHVGSLVWPKFGYDGITEITLAEISDSGLADYLIEIGALDPSFTMLRESTRKEFKVSDILSAVDSNGKSIGLDWWDNNHRTFDGSFDLSPNSLSMRIVNQYYKRKAMEFDIDEEDLLSKDLPIFNLDSSGCWITSLKDNREGVIETIRKYPKEFKSVYYSDDWMKAEYNSEASTDSDLSNAISDATGLGLVRLGSMDSDIDNTVMKSIWAQIGERRLNINRKIEAISELKPSNLSEVIKLKQELNK
jgi:hypothetical protein